MKTAFARIPLRKDQISHNNVDRVCWVCGKPGPHGVDFNGVENGFGTIYFCTYHFARMFKAPVNRFPKKLRQKSTPAASLEFQERRLIIARHMDMPLDFFGQKLICHAGNQIFEDTRIHLFFSLYGMHESNNLVLTVTAVAGKRAIPFVTMLSMPDLPARLKAAKTFLISVQDGLRETAFEVEATQFLTDVYTTYIA